MNPRSKLKSVFLTSLSIGFLAFALWPASNTAASRSASPGAQNPQKPYKGFPDFGQMISSNDFETMRAQYKKSGEYMPGPFRLAQDFSRKLPTDTPDFFKNGGVETGRA
jgi:hypothetical protein